MKGRAEMHLHPADRPRMRVFSGEQLHLLSESVDESFLQRKTVRQDGQKFSAGLSACIFLEENLD